jgi:hypothetical protein
MVAYYCYSCRQWIASELLYYSPPINRQRQYPKNIVTTFQNSAKAMNQLIEEMTLILVKINSSKEFAKRLRSAAQLDNKEQVIIMIKEAGVTANIKIKYNPDQLVIHLYNNSGSTSVTLPW